MNTRIKTNQLVYQIDRITFRQKYDLYCIETTDKYIQGGAYILDSPSLNSDIKCVQYSSGRTLIIMMLHKDANKMILRKWLNEVEGGNKLSFHDCNVDDLSDNVLLQLMFNALSSYDSDFLKYSNLTGHLYCFHPDWLKHGKDRGSDIIWKVPCFEIKVSKNCCLGMDVRTFTSERLKKSISFGKRKFEDYPKYVFGKNYTLRRKLPGDSEDAYIMRQVDGCKTEIPFLDIKDEKHFDRCKVAVLEKIRGTFNSQYDSIANIEFGYSNIAKRIDYKKNAAKENDRRIREVLNTTGIHIVDRIGDGYSERFCDDMRNLINRKYGVQATIGKRIKKSSLNICVIHNVEYYDGTEDPHDKEYSGVAVQHVTLEDFSDNAEFAIDTVVHEVIIKRDIVDGRISLFDWDSTGLNEEVSFGIEEQIGDEYRYFFMCVRPDGSFEIKEQEFTLFEMNEYTDCVNIFEDARTASETIKGLIRNQHGEINIIKDTGIITLPETGEIKLLLSEGDTKLRGREKREELLSSCLDIKTYNDNEGRYCYFVGTIGEGMRWSIPRAANVRCIEGYNGAPLMFDKLLSTMSVTFVRNGQLTVLPFPFKYLREYLLMKH